MEDKRKLEQSVTRGIITFRICEVEIGGEKAIAVTQYFDDRSSPPPRLWFCTDGRPSASQLQDLSIFVEALVGSAIVTAMGVQEQML